jgi:endonuclease/exonuclease/phosphatase (EEP) superfamily protein YafD
MILAGDLNTWTSGRREIVDAVAARLSLQEVRLATDGRSRFWGQQVDHIFVRGIDVLDSASIEVASSDHNPVRATLRVRIGRR